MMVKAKQYYVILVSRDISPSEQTAAEKPKAGDEGLHNLSSVRHTVINAGGRRDTLYGVTVKRK